MYVRIYDIYLMGILTTRLHLVLAVVAVLLVIADPVVRDALAVVATKRVRRTLRIDASDIAATCAAQAATWKGRCKMRGYSKFRRNATE